jgi:PPM family protein phosphatase
LSDAGEALIAAANDAGGRDNITVVLLRLEDVNATASSLVDRRRAGTEVDPVAEGGTGEVAAQSGDRVAMTGAVATPAPVSRRQPRRPSGRASGESPTRARRRRRWRRAAVVGGVLIVLGLIGSAAYLGSQSVYFIGTNSRGLVTLFRGVPYRLPGNLNLYSSDFVSGVSASTLSPERRRTLLDHSLRSEANAAALMRSLELGQLK